MKSKIKNLFEIDVRVRKFLHQEYERFTEKKTNLTKYYDLKRNTKKNSRIFVSKK